MVSLLIWLDLGFVVGYLAKMVLPGREGGGILVVTTLGLVGEVVGGGVGQDV